MLVIYGLALGIMFSDPVQAAFENGRFPNFSNVPNRLDHLKSIEPDLTKQDIETRIVQILSRKKRTRRRFAIAIDDVF